MVDRQLKGVSQHLGTLFRVGVLGRESDGALLDRFLDDPEPTAEAAFATLVERHGPMVLRVSRRLLPDPNDADDAAQAAFLLLPDRPGRSASDPRSFMAAKGQPWPQALLGLLPNPTADAFGVEDNPIALGLGHLLPGFVLIGPDGQVLAIDPYGRDLESILAETLDPEPNPSP